MVCYLLDPTPSLNSDLQFDSSSNNSKVTNDSNNNKKMKNKLEVGFHSFTNNPAIPFRIPPVKQNSQAICSATTSLPPHIGLNIAIWQTFHAHPQRHHPPPHPPTPLTKPHQNTHTPPTTPPPTNHGSVVWVFIWFGLWRFFLWMGGFGWGVAVVGDVKPYLPSLPPMESLVVRYVTSTLLSYLPPTIVTPPSFINLTITLLFHEF